MRGRRRRGHFSESWGRRSRVKFYRVLPGGGATSVGGLGSEGLGSGGAVAGVAWLLDVAASERGQTAPGPQSQGHQHKDGEDDFAYPFFFVS